MGTEPINLSIEQSTSFSNGSTKVNSFPFVLSNNPITDNILLSILNVNQYNEARTPTPPDGTWNYVDSLASTLSKQYIYWKKVSIGDGTNYTFSISGTTEFQGGVLIELNGANTTNPIDEYSMVDAGNTNINASPSITPNVLGTLALSYLTCIDGTAPYGMAINSISSGWTIGIDSMPLWCGTFSAVKDNLTSDTVTSISNTFWLNGVTGGAVISTILIKS